MTLIKYDVTKDDTCPIQLIQKYFVETFFSNFDAYFIFLRFPYSILPFLTLSPVEKKTHRIEINVQFLHSLFVICEHKQTDNNKI